MLRIRLRRTGKKRQASYRVVVADQRAPRDGDFVEVLGHYNPRTQPSVFEVNEERVKHWLSVGASPSDTVQRLLHARGLTTVEPHTRQTKPSKAEREAAAAAAEAARAEAVAAEAAAQAAAAAAAPAEGDTPAEAGTTA